MDRYLNEAAAAGIAADPTANVLILTPRPSTYGTEREIQKVLDTPGHMGLEVRSMENVAEDILDSVYGGALEFVNAAGKSMLIRGILDRHREDLQAFRAIAAAPELPAAISVQIARLRQMNIAPDELAQYARDNPGKLRIADLALVYTELDQLMQGRTDSEGAVDLAIEHMRGAWFLKDALVIVRGFAEWNAQQIRFVEALMAQAGHMIIEIPSVDAGAPDHALYRTSELARDRLLGAAMKDLRLTTIESGGAGDIVTAACELFSHQPFRPLQGDAMEITSHADAEAEMRSVAAEIVRLHEEEGVAFDDMAIVWGETQEYEPLIRRIFSEAHIPYFTGERKTLADSNIAEFVLTACELLSGQLRKDAVLAHAATGFTDLDPDELGQLINYTRMMVSWGHELEKEFSPAESRRGRFRDSISDAEAARRKLMNPILAGLRPRRRQGSVFDALDAYVAEHLSEDRIAAKAADMETDYEQVSFMLQSAEAILALIRQAAQLLSGDTDGADLRRVLRAGFEAVELSLVPAALDEVQAGPLMRMHVPPVSHLFFVGANDEVLPRLSEPGGDLLTPAEWTELVSGLKHFRPQSNVEAQKYRIVRAMMQARDKVHWSYHSGGEAKPSIIIEYLRQIYRSDSGGRDGEVPAAVVRQRMLRLKQNAYEEVVGMVRQAADGAQAEIDEDLAAAVLFDPEFALRTEQLQESLTRPNEAVPAAPRQPGRSFSATRLETYGACPYKHFVRYQLHAWTPDDAVIGAAATGTFMHGALDVLARRTQGCWSDRSEEEFLSILQEAADSERVAQIGEDPHPRNWARLDAVEPRLREAALAMRAQQAAGLLHPFVSEIQFSEPLGADYIIRGVIDRIDAAQLPEGRYLSLVDYKSSDHDFSLSGLLLGTEVQLMMYLLALDQMVRRGAAVGAAQLEAADRLAGGGFLNLLPTLEAKPGDIRAAYRLMGLLTVLPDTARQLYGSGRFGTREGLLSFAQMINKASGTYPADTWRVFAPESGSGGNETLEALLNCGRGILKASMEGCTAGVNVISPARTDALACRHCDYGSVCRFEAAAKPDAIRQAPVGKGAELRQRLLGQYGQPARDGEVDE